MGISNKEQKLKTAKLIGSIYFLGLGLINFCATFFFAKVNPIDFIILSFGFLPILINKKIFFIIFGLFAAFISLYIGFACLTFNLNPEIHTSQVSYNMGYLLAATSFFSSLLLLYVGLNLPEKSKLNTV